MNLNLNFIIAPLFYRSSYSLVTNDFVAINIYIFSEIKLIIFKWIALYVDVHLRLSSPGDSHANTKITAMSETVGC